MCRRLVAVAGVLGVLSIGLASSAATAAAAGGLSCAGGGAAGPSPVASASQGNGLSAASWFQSVSGTTETDVFISAFQGSGAGSGSIAFVEIVVSDTATGIPSLDASGCADNADFQVDQTLTSARLGPTTLEVVDANTNTSTTATVSADWTGTGAMSHTTQVSHFHSGNFTNIFNFIGFERIADATGAATDPELNVSFDGAAQQASLDKVNDVFILVCVGGCA